MNRQVKAVSIIVLALVYLFIFQNNLKGAEGIRLIDSNLSTWRGNTGEWKIVGDVSLDPNNKKLLSTKQGSGIIINGHKGKTVDLISKAEFGDFEAHVEFMISRGSNSGVYIQGQYEVQIYDTRNGKADYPGIECGGIYERWDEKRSPKGYEGHSPRVNASLPPGQWQSFDIVFRAARFDKEGKKTANARVEKILHNGTLIHENVELTGPTRGSMHPDDKPTGPLRLQGDHGPVAFRNIRIVPLN